MFGWGFHAPHPNTGTLPMPADRFDALIAELADVLERSFPEGGDNPANITTTSGRVLTVLPNEAYEKLLADAMAWRAFNRGQPETATAQETLALFWGEKNADQAPN